MKVPFEIDYFHVEQTDSTCEEVKRLWTHSLHAERDEERRRMICVRADYQTAGRGQKGTSWEAQKGKNLLFSIVFEPSNVAVGRSFVLSQAMALAVRDALAACVEDYSAALGLPCGLAHNIRIKWPNDIYFGDRKLCGTIIETTFGSGRVGRCAIGVGVNVNQREFRSDAPNPVALCSVVGCEVNCEELLNKILDNFQCNILLVEEGDDSVGSRYEQCLIRREGIHSYRDANGVFEAEFVSVAPDGQLTLRDREGRLRAYSFKQVRHIFSNMEVE